MQDAGSLTKGFVDNASSGTNYLYDANGNLTQDIHKTMIFTYNHVNLPNSLVKDGISNVTWTYTANGEKVTKVGPGGTRNYVSGIEYLGANTDAIYHAEGRCMPNGSSWYYDYTLKDHLGDTRVNFRANGTAVTYLEDFHYYPFGMAMEGLGTILSTGNDYRYNGKELNEDYSLNWYDYGARWYDPAVGRWGGVDPLSEKSSNFSVYNYVINNPIRLIDPDGMAAAPITLQGGMGDDPNPMNKLKAAAAKIASDVIVAVDNTIEKVKETKDDIVNWISNFGVGEGFEELTENGPGTMPLTQARDGATSIIMVDQMVWPVDLGGIVGMAAQTTKFGRKMDDAKNMIESTNNAIRNLFPNNSGDGNNKIENVLQRIDTKPARTSGIDTLPGKSGAPDTIRTTNHNPKPGDPTVIYKPVKKQ